MNIDKSYWLELHRDFFSQRAIKKLRKQAGGDTYTLIYIKLKILSVKNNGKILFKGECEDIIEQLSQDIDENINNIKTTLEYLQKNKLANISDTQDIDLINKEQIANNQTQKSKQKVNVFIDEFNDLIGENLKG